MHITFQFELDFTGENDKAFEDGLEVGRSWDANWYPGGPWFIKGDDAGRLRNAYYREGVSVGLEENFTKNPDFKQWFAANRHSISAVKYKGVGDKS